MTREEVLGFVPKETVRRVEPDPPELGACYVRLLSADERDAIETKWMNELEEKKTDRHVRGDVLAAVWSDKDGKRLFRDEDATRLGRLPTRCTERIIETGQGFNNWNKTEVLEKNSETDHGSDSSSS